MNLTINLDTSECSFDPIEAIEYVKHGAIFRISKKNPYLQEILMRYDIEIIKEEDDVIYFRVL